MFCGVHTSVHTSDVSRCSLPERLRGQREGNASCQWNVKAVSCVWLEDGGFKPMKEEPWLVIKIPHGGWVLIFFSFHEALLTFTPVNLSVCLLARVWRLLRQEVRGGRQTFSVSGGGLRWWGSQSGADISRKTFLQSYVHTVTPGQRGLTQQPGAEWRNVMIII